MRTKLSLLGILVTSSASIIAALGTVSWYTDTHGDVCDAHPFWNSGAMLLIPLLTWAALILAYIGARINAPGKALRYASYIFPSLVLAWSVWLLSHYQLFPCGFF